MMGTTTARHDVQALGLRHRPGAAARRAARRRSRASTRARRNASTSRSPARAAATSSASASRKARRQRRDAVAPFKEIRHSRPAGRATVCFADVTCPSWSPPTATAHAPRPPATARRSTCRSRSAAGSTATTVGAFDVTITKVEPVVSGSTGTGGSGGGTASCMQPSGSGTLTQQFQDAHVMCPKDYIVQNNAWGSTAGQTVTFGPGAKFKVTVQNENRTGNTTPASTRRSAPARTTTAARWAAACRARSARSPPAASRPAGPGPTNAASGSYNAAYDVWFSTGAGGDPAGVSAERRLPDGLVQRSAQQPADRRRRSRTAS